MNNLSFSKVVCLVFVFCAATATASHAQAFHTLASFDGTNGYNPYYVTLVQGFDGDFYGTTYFGTIFKITAQGTVTIVGSVVGQTGDLPYAGLVLGTDGNFYGTAHSGGAGYCPTGCGTVFKVTPGGTLTALYSFSEYGGQYPYDVLVQAIDGDFYGTTGGGFTEVGTVFKITPRGTLTTLYYFDGTDGSFPIAGLVQATDGDFYGTTAGNTGGDCSQNNCGTVFRITPEGTLTTLHSFDGTDGSGPTAGLVQATNGVFYGTTQFGGANGLGTIFKITRLGTLTTLHSFEGTDGSGPMGGLLQATNGDFYGTTTYGGANNDGTVFGYSEGLPPFVATLPTSGRVGATVRILGNDLKGSTTVTFNGRTAEFSVVSGSEITAIVPHGATTGRVRVTTLHGTLVSNVFFRVEHEFCDGRRAGLCRERVPR